MVLLSLSDYQLVIVCSNENKEKRSYIMEHLQLSLRDVTAVIAKDDIIHNYLNHHLSKNATFGQQVLASDVDLNKLVENYYYYISLLNTKKHAYALDM